MAWVCINFSNLWNKLSERPDDFQREKRNWKVKDKVIQNEISSMVDGRQSNVDLSGLCSCSLSSYMISFIPFYGYSLQNWLKNQLSLSSQSNENKYGYFI